ncbi:ROK family protein [Mollicutes bacterium LVI A0039]|nr:ROK family protein [Mollicutes bacterium LVI A0039]
MKIIKNYNQGQSLINYNVSFLKKERFIQSSPQTFEGFVNLKDIYIPIMYPVRKEFEEYSKNTSLNRLEPKYVYTPFESNKVDYSTFLGQPYMMESSGYCTIISEADHEVEIELRVCGDSSVYLNDVEVSRFSPFTRIHPESTIVKLPLKKGENKMEIHIRDIAERDINFSFETILLTDTNLTTEIDISDLQEYDEVSSLLSSIYFQDETINSGIAVIKYDNQMMTRDRTLSLAIRHNELPYDALEKEDECNPIQSTLDYKIDVLFKKDSNVVEVDFGTLADFTSFMLFKFEKEDMFMVRRLYLSKYTMVDPEIDQIEERKAFARKYISENGRTTVMRVYCDLAINGSISSANQKKLDEQLQFINNRDDCADFEVIGLIQLYRDFKDIIDSSLKKQIEDAILDFRYWCNEPGVDAMWYFSENHGLNFHTAQFMAGDTFMTSKFSNSGKFGEEHRAEAKERLMAWFDHFIEYGLAEWNSTTYIPIDLNALFVLYHQNFDVEIKSLATKALDYCFETIANNLTNKTMASSFGRVYETELKAFEFGELSFISWIMWNKGYINWSSRAVSLYLITDYHYDFQEKLGLIEKFEGYKKVNTKIYKYPNASIASVCNYKANERGIQQHVFHINMPNECHIWLNHPGELLPSGEGRPSFWSGNGIFPLVTQEENTANIKWQLHNSWIKQVHMYVPMSKVDVKFDNEVITISDGEYTVLVKTNNKYHKTITGANTNREIVFYGEEIEFEVQLIKINGEEIMNKILAFDIGGTNLKYGLVSKAGQVSDNGKVTSPESYDQLLKLMASIYEQHKQNVVPALAISCPSVYKGGKVVGSSYLSYIIGKDIIGDLQSITGVKCYIENDGNCSALGEYYFGGNNVSSLAAIVIGSGVGGGVIINDQLLKGANLVAGELGFPLFNYQLGDEKPYNLFGSVTGMTNFIHEAKKIDPNVPDAEYVFDSEEPKFEALKQKETDIIAMQIINLQYIVDPELIIIGGAISKNQKFMNRIKDSLNRYYEKLPYHDTKSNVKASSFANENNLLGSTVAYWRENE